MPSRSQISQALRGAWGPQDRAAARQAIGGKQGAFAQCLKNAMRSNAAGVDAYRRCAEQAGIGPTLSRLWTD
jgi:hypothetical protein